MSREHGQTIHPFSHRSGLLGSDGLWEGKAGQGRRRRWGMGEGGRGSGGG